MTQFGFAGNLRYVALPAALVCVLAGAGWVDVFSAVRARLGRTAATALAVVLALVALPFLIADVGSLRRNVNAIRSEADFYDALPAVIAKAGGRDAVKRCKVYTGPYQVQALAWHLTTPAMRQPTSRLSASSVQLSLR